jgi:hypothetical protein
MDKRTLVAFGGVLAVAVGVFVRDPETGDVVSSEATLWVEIVRLK